MIYFASQGQSAHEARVNEIHDESNKERSDVKGSDKRSRQAVFIKEPVVKGTWPKHH